MNKKQSLQRYTYSVDIDPNIFGNVPYNFLPEKFFKKIRQQKELEGYGELNDIKQRKLKMVEELIPNWKKEIADANNLPCLLILLMPQWFGELLI